MIDTTRSFTITVTIYADTYAKAKAFRDEIQSNLESVERPEDFFVGSVMEIPNPNETHEQAPPTYRYQPRTMGQP